MANTLVDFTFGIKREALSVLHLLDREPDFADYDNGFYQIECETKPWYNGRERGFVLSSRHPRGCRVLHIAVFEHRNSDALCALKWITDNNYWNHPLEDQNIFDKAYHGANKWDVAHSVGWGESGKMANWVYREMKEFYLEEKAARAS